MGNNRPVKVKDWIKFLKAHGCRYDRTTNHEVWKCPNCRRSIIFRGHHKSIPPMHLKTNLDTMGYDLQYLYNWLEKK